MLIPTRYSCEGGSLDAKTLLSPREQRRERWCSERRLVENLSEINSERGKADPIIQIHGG